MKTIFKILCCAALIGASAGCTDDKDDGVDANLLVGKWHCTYQKWVEKGEEWDASYNANDGNYYIRFNGDGSGELDSGIDELLELGGYYEFTWSVSGNTIHAQVAKPGNNPFEDIWQIKQLSEGDLTLYWESDSGSYHITCNLVKVN